METPDAFMNKIFKKLKLDPASNEDQIIWTRAIVNDTFHSDFCVRYYPLDVAAAAVFTARKWLELPSSEDWFREIRVNVHNIKGL